MFDADRPIQSSQQDRLGRTTFAKYLARCVLDHKNTESLVIGLYGSWGTGKTSVINLTLEELRAAASNMFDDEQPIILNFSAWSYSGQNQLVYSFFRRLSSEIRHAPFLKNPEKIIHLLELYVSFFTHKPIPSSLRPKRSFFKKLFRHQKEDVFGWESGRDLTQVKAELNTLLSEKKHKIIIFIDNISRLDDAEIKQIFQIVKSMGDYVNTVYLLSLDKDQVIEAMNHIHDGNGAQYLEKVVQLPFDIPAISHQDLENIFLEKMQGLISVLPEDSWNKQYWADIYYSSLKYLFENCRDITRYINTVSFGFSRVKDLVNPVDFFAISAIHTFSPHVYFGIRDNKDLFTDLMDNVFEYTPEKRAEDKARCDEIIQRTERIPHDMLTQLLIRLFPRLRNLYQANIEFYHSEAQARQDHRICSPDVFDIYFRLSMPTGYIPEAELHALLSITHDANGFALALLRLNQDDKITRFLDLLDGAAITQIPEKYISNVVKALIDSADLFPEGENNLLSFNTVMRVHRILHQLLGRVETQEKRAEILRDAIKESTNSIYIIVHELTVLTHEQHQTPVEDFPLESLKKLATAKIISWAETKRLSEHPKLLPILYAWKEWGVFEECSRYVAELIQDDKGLTNFLCAALKKPIDQASTALEKNPAWKKYLENITAFIPIAVVEPRAKVVFENDNFEKLREREQLAILIFLDLVNATTVKVIPKTGV